MLVELRSLGAPDKKKCSQHVHFQLSAWLRMGILSVNARVCKDSGPRVAVEDTRLLRGVGTAEFSGDVAVVPLFDRRLPLHPRLPAACSNSPEQPQAACPHALYLSSVGTRTIGLRQGGVLGSTATKS